MSRSAARLIELALILASASVRHVGFNQINGHVGAATSTTWGWESCC
jgi:hypothetical protein